MAPERELFFRTCPTDQAVKGGGGEQECAGEIITGRFLATNSENQPAKVVSVPGIACITSKSNGAYEVFVRTNTYTKTPLCFERGWWTMNTCDINSSSKGLS